ELDRRDVDRDAQVSGPGRGVAAGLAQRPFAKLRDKVGVLRDRDEDRRRYPPEPRMVPAQQRLEPRHLFGLRGDDRLVMHGELAIAERVDQIMFEQLAVFGGLEQVRGEEA